MNGFEPWFCAADTDFMVRLYKMKSKVLHTNDVLFRRRIHSQGLTSKPETGFRSPKRHQYQKMSKAKVGIGNPSILHIRDCVLIDDLVEYSSNTEIFSNHDNIRALNAVFNKTPKKVVQNEVKSKQQVVANNPLLNLLNSKSKQIDKEKITEQRQNIINIRQKTNKDVYKELHPSKPNRRLDLPRLKL